MRFIDSGPDIPNELLEARDNGTVVFLCGAGVSMPAGLPGFKTLTDQVMADLGVDDGIRELRHVLSFDQLFNQLCREFGRASVIRAVRKELRTPKNADTANHAALLQLSSDLNGNPRIVTTNFDLLFERPNRSIKRYVAPELPDLGGTRSFAGLVYLHGRLSKSRINDLMTDDLILSSSDFGRAYLAQGWAASFVRELLQRFTVVLVGYSAEDSPVRYLLEGLDLSDHRQPNRIYAFAPGDENESRAHWQERNVEAIPYAATNHDHSLLWDSIRLWADRASSPARWATSIVELAARAPSSLTAVERGQVCSLISTENGARAFADAKLDTHPEWICVLDPSLRLGERQEANEYLNREEFVPKDVWGLDSDPVAADEANTENRRGIDGLDFLAAFPSERRDGTQKKLANQDSRSSLQLPPRLRHLARWIADHLDSPVILWWAAQQNSLNPEILRQVKWQLDHPNKVTEMKWAEEWRWILHASDQNRLVAEVDDRPYVLESEIKASGWTIVTRNKLEEFLKPKLVVSGPTISRVEPPKPDYDRREFMRFQMKYPTGSGSRVPKIPDEELVEGFRYARRGLEYAAKVIGATNQYLTSSPTFYPENKPGRASRNNYDTHLLWVGRLFTRLCEASPKHARQELGNWPHGKAFFDKLKLHALSHEGVFSSSDVFEYLESCNDEAFWESRNRRDLLFLLRNRWSKFSANEQEQVVQRFLDGPPKWPHEEKQKFKRRKVRAALDSLNWLYSEGCPLPEGTIPKLESLEKYVPDWQLEWAKYAAASNEGHVGWVSTNTEFQQIDELPFAEMAKAFEKSTKRPFEEFTDYRPFKGMVEERLVRALSFLGYEWRHRRYPVDRWHEALDVWPEDATIRQVRLFAFRVVQLPRSVFFELRYRAGYWLRKHLGQIAKTDEEAAMEIWDAFFDQLSSGGEAATSSSVGEITVGGNPVARSRRTHHYASGPVADLTEIIIDLLSKSDPQESQGVPNRFKKRLEALWSLPGEGADHAVSLTARHINWLAWIDPKWVREKILPMTSFDHKLAEPAWNGLLQVQSFWPPSLFQSLKSDFSSLGPKISGWGWEGSDEETFAQWVIVACWWNLKEKKYLSWAETRTVLKSISEVGRQRAIWTISDIVSKHEGQWKTFAKPFLDKAWPKELRYKSSAVSYNLVCIAENAGDDFPDAVNSILPLMVAPDHPDLFLFGMKEKAGDEKEGTELAARFPQEVLLLLDKMISPQEQIPPYGLGSVLKLIAKHQPDVRQDLRWIRLSQMAGIA